VLTEAEDEARDRLARTLAKVSEWHGERARYGGAAQDWHTRCETACADAAALLAASRGDVPPEARPVRREIDNIEAMNGPEEPLGDEPTAAEMAPEMAVTTGEDAPARQCVAVLATNAAGKVLLVRTRRGWELPGGGVEPGESPSVAAAREVLEETGLPVLVPFDATPETILGTAKPGASYRSRIMLYRATAEGEPKAGSDALMAMWARASLVLATHEIDDLSDLDTRPALLAWAREATACNVDHSPGERPRVLGGECAECLHRPPLHEPTCTKARCSHVVEICEGCDDLVSECVCEGQRARASEARTWTEEQIRAAWYRAQETGRPSHERPREPDDLATGWEHVRAALHREAV
jgi:8-oxo-dGTP pyrophosphatase MutT (NUDIX family)